VKIILNKSTKSRTQVEITEDPYFSDPWFLMFREVTKTNRTEKLKSVFVLADLDVWLSNLKSDGWEIISRE